jgi:hypothetical protein
VFESEAEKARELESATHKALGHRLEEIEEEQVQATKTAEISEKAL